MSDPFLYNKHPRSLSEKLIAMPLAGVQKAKVLTMQFDTVSWPGHGFKLTSARSKVEDITDAQFLSIL